MLVKLAPGLALALVLESVLVLSIVLKLVLALERVQVQGPVQVEWVGWKPPEGSCLMEGSALQELAKLPASKPGHLPSRLSMGG